MALTGYLKVTGKTQGQIKGDCDQSDSKKKDTMLVYQMDHTIEIPKDTHTGLPTGQRIHNPLCVTVHKNNGSPKIHQALCKGEQCTVELNYFRIKPDGKEENYYTIKLENAILVNVRSYTPMTFLPDNKPFHDMEVYCFTYSKVTWTYNDGNIEFTDDWKGA